MQALTIVWNSNLMHTPWDLLSSSSNNSTDKQSQVLSIIKMFTSVWSPKYDSMIFIWFHHIWLSKSIKFHKVVNNLLVYQHRWSMISISSNDTSGCHLNSTKGVPNEKIQILLLVDKIYPFLWWLMPRSSCSPYH